MLNRIRLAVEVSLAVVVIATLMLALYATAKKPVIRIVADNSPAFVYFTDFNNHTYLPITPTDITKLCLVQGSLTAQQMRELTGLISHPQELGRFEWFQTRLCLMINGRSRLYVDSSGGFFDTESGVSGRLTAADFKLMGDFMARFRSTSQQ